jgi:hypothetical protein
MLQGMLRNSNQYAMLYEKLLTYQEDDLDWSLEKAL